MYVKSFTSLALVQQNVVLQVEFCSALVVLVDFSSHFDVVTGDFFKRGFPTLHPNLSLIGYLLTK
jgi:hypothetical protein